MRKEEKLTGEQLEDNFNKILDIMGKDMKEDFGYKMVKIYSDLVTNKKFDNPLTKLLYKQSQDFITYYKNFCKKLYQNKDFFRQSIMIDIQQTKKKISEDIFPIIKENIDNGYCMGAIIQYNDYILMKQEEIFSPLFLVAKNRELFDPQFVKTCKTYLQYYIDLQMQIKEDFAKMITELKRTHQQNANNESLIEGAQKNISQICAIINEIKNNFNALMSRDQDKLKNFEFQHWQKDDFEELILSFQDIQDYADFINNHNQNTTNDKDKIVFSNFPIAQSSKIVVDTYNDRIYLKYNLEQMKKIVEQYNITLEKLRSITPTSKATQIYIASLEDIRDDINERLKKLDLEERMRQQVSKEEMKKTSQDLLKLLKQKQQTTGNDKNSKTGTKQNKLQSIKNKTNIRKNNQQIKDKKLLLPKIGIKKQTKNNVIVNKNLKNIRSNVKFKQK